MAEIPWLSCTCCMRVAKVICSMNLPGTEIRLTGLFFPGSFFKPLLYMGVKFGNFQSLERPWLIRASGKILKMKQLNFVLIAMHPVSIKFSRTISHRSTFQCLCCQQFEQNLFEEEIIMKLFQEIAERY